MPSLLTNTCFTSMIQIDERDNRTSSGNLLICGHYNNLDNIVLLSMNLN